MKKQKVNTSYRIKISRMDYQIVRQHELAMPYGESFICSYRSEGFDLFDFDKTGLYYSVNLKHDKKKNHKKLLKAFKKYIIKCRRHRLGK